MSTGAASGAPARWKLIAAFLAIYLIWGSTYLAIRFAIETLPGFLMAGVRFLTAGSVLYGWARLTGAAGPKREHWRDAAIMGALMLLVGNGCVVWAEHALPSGLVALLIATEPLMVALLSWLWLGRGRPGGLGLAGLVVGFIGVALLIGPGWMSGEAMHLPYVALILVASFCWAAGSLYGLKASTPTSPLLAAGMQMLMGGVFLTTLGTLSGGWSQFHPEAVSLRSVGAMAYLIVGGSLMGYTAYSWLLKVISPARASTYAYVNPVVAVLLGWALGGEGLSWNTVLATPVIIASVALISIRQPAPPAAAEPALEPSAGPGPRSVESEPAGLAASGAGDGAAEDEEALSAAVS